MGAVNLSEEGECNRFEGGSIANGPDSRQDNRSDGERIMNMDNAVYARERWRHSPRLLTYRSDWMGSGV